MTPRLFVGNVTMGAHNTSCNNNVNQLLIAEYTVDNYNYG